MVATGWDDVLEEAKEAKIPVVLLDSNIETTDDSLYLTAVTSDQVHEQGRRRLLVGQVGSKPCNVVELQGTTGSSPAIARKKGFEEALKGHDNIKLTRSQTGDFTAPHQGQEVMESFIKAENGGKNICAVYAHNERHGGGPSRRSRKPA